MAWSDHWKYIRYGVATLVGMAATVGLYVTWPDVVEDDYIPPELYAACLLGTVERCTATAEGLSITTNVVTNVEPLYVADPSGAMWTPTGGTPTNYLIFTMATNVVTVVSTSLIYTVFPPVLAIVSEERVTVGRIISGYQTNYHDTNGAFHKSPPEDASTNSTWEVVSVYTNDSPAIYTNGFTNALTAYIPAGAVQALQDTVYDTISFYCNTNTAGLDAWTITGMFTACGFPNGWDTNAGSQYLAKTNFAQIYSVLSKLRYRKYVFAGTLGSSKAGAKGATYFSESIADAKIGVEAQWPTDTLNEYEEGIWTRNLQTFSGTAFQSWAGHTPYLPVYWFYDTEWGPLALYPSNSTIRLICVVSTNLYTGSDAERVFDSQGTDLVFGTNIIDSVVSSYHYSAGRHTFTCSPIIRMPSVDFDLNWADNPYVDGKSMIKGLKIESVTLPDSVAVGFGFLYCTNAP